MRLVRDHNQRILSVGEQMDYARKQKLCAIESRVIQIIVTIKS